VEFASAASAMPRVSSDMTWSRCSEINGETTTVGPSTNRAGSW
jgi:hypothetical protein